MLPIPPVLFRVFRRSVDFSPLAHLALRNYEPVIRTLRENIRIHPDGLLYLALGEVLLAAGRFAEAEEACLAAGEAASVIPLRRPTLLLTIQCAWLHAIDPGRDPRSATWSRFQPCQGHLGAALAAAGPLGPLRSLAGLALPPEGPRGRALRHVRRFVTLYEVRPDEAYYLSHVAIMTGEYDLARWILTQWQRQAPHEPEALARRATAELRAGANGPALAAAEKLLAEADKALSRKPDDKGALKYRARAQEYRATARARLREEARAVRP
jgi:tetratricopeptide (TPR) repeat protein